MKNIILIASFLFICQFSYAQKSSIELLKGEKEIKISTTTTVFSIYITKTGEIYFEDEKVELHEIGAKLNYFSSKLPVEIEFRKKLFLYIDKNVNYNIVDAVKTQLAHNNIQYIYYKTETIEDKDILKGESAINYYSIFKYKSIEKIETKLEKEIHKRISDSITKLSLNDSFGSLMPPPPPPPAFETSITYYYRLYSDRQEIIDETLSDKSVKCIKLNNKEVTIGDDKIKIDELETLKKKLKDLDFVFLNFDINLSFSNYFKVRKFLKSVAMDLFKNNDKRFHIIEISNEMNEIYELNKIKLCN